MSQIRPSVVRSFRLTVLMLGLAGLLAACNAHDSGRRGHAHYSDRGHWSDGDRHRDRPGRFGWRQDRRDDNRHYDRRRWPRNRR